MRKYTDQSRAWIEVQNRHGPSDRPAGAGRDCRGP